MKQSKFILGTMKELIIKILYKLGFLTFIRFFYNFYQIFKHQVKFAKMQTIWRYMNKNNHTTIGNKINEIDFPIDKVTVGKHSYGVLCVYNFGAIGERLNIRNYCSIASGVKFILGGNHNINTFSTYPFRHFFNNEKYEALSRGEINVEDDVWIGTNAIILSGVTLAKGTIVAAGSVVTKSTIPYSIVGGNPAKLIKKRFDESLINTLIDIDFDKIDEKKIPRLLLELYSPLNEELVGEIKNKLIK